MAENKIYKRKYKNALGFVYTVGFGPSISKIKKAYYVEETTGSELLNKGPYKLVLVNNKTSTYKTISYFNNKKKALSKLEDITNEDLSKWK